MWPLRASRPVTPEPGSIGLSSSSSTVVFASMAKRGCMPSPLPTIEPWPPVSEAPKPSITRVVGSRPAKLDLNGRRKVAVAGHRAAEPTRAAAEDAEEGVLVAPQHALGHAGGAAGVEDVEVVAGAALDDGALR